VHVHVGPGASERERTPAAEDLSAPKSAPKNARG